LIDRHSPGSTRCLTAAADKGYDTADHCISCDCPRSYVAWRHEDQKRPASALDVLAVVGRSLCNIEVR
jgi:hypothetical protein